MNLIKKTNPSWNDLAESIGVTADIVDNIKKWRSPTKSGKTSSK